MQENYDADRPLAHARTTGMPIDASISVDFLDEGPLTASTPVDALKGFTGSMRFKQCFVRQLFRFYTGRDETAGRRPACCGRCSSASPTNDEQDIVQLLRALASSTSFSQRSEAP